MATKTTACSECGAAIDPGRYACAECGALLAAVASAPRLWVAAPLPSTASLADAPASTITRAGVDAPAVAVAAAPPTTHPTKPSSGARSRPRRGGRASDEARAAATPPPPEASKPEPIPQMERAVEPTLGAADPPRPAWPAPIDLPPFEVGGPVATPAVPRTPAGAYLAPSAVLPPLDAPIARNGHSHAAASEPGRPAANAAAPASTAQRLSLTETLDGLGITADMPRRLVGGGAAVAVLGFLLPWVAPLGGAGLIDRYLDGWGLAGPGHWIVVVGLLGLVALAFADRPFGRVRVGGLAIFTAALLIGLLWQYVFAAASTSVGVWIVLAGAVLVAAGGVVDLRRRHATDASAV